MANLTKSFVDKVSTPDKGYSMHWDEKVRGYGLRVTKEGKKVFVASSRVKGKQVNFTIGPFGAVTESEAREKARKILQGMREGVDPRDVRKQDEAAKVTLRDVADAYKGRPGKLKESSKSEIERHVTTTFAKWLHQPIASITEDDCRKRYREMLTKGLRGKGPAPGQANQGFACLRALINYASRRYKKADGTPVIIHNPVSVLKDDWVTLPERNTRIPDSKVGIVWHSLEEWREAAYNHNTLSSIDLIMFLILTGSRIGEASALTWDRVNMEEGWWHIPDPKNKNPVYLPLSSQALNLLKTRLRRRGSPFVFPSWSKSGHIQSPRDTMDRVSELAGLHLSPHDLRRTFITIGVAQCGIDLHKLELLTNHVPRGVTARHYLETTHLQYLKPEAQRIANWITTRAAMASGANIIPLRA